MDMNQVLAAELNVKPWQVEAAVKLIDEGNTIPFISRYRKEATGSLNDEILDKEELAAELIKNMSGRYGKRLEERYGVTLVENTAGDGEDTKKAWEILREIARARSCLLKGSELDTKKAAGFLLDDFRSGKLGRVTLEVPEV